MSLSQAPGEGKAFLCSCVCVMLSAWVQAWDHAQTQGPVLELNGQFLIQGMGKVGQG